MNTLKVKKYDEPEFCEMEILRYAGCREKTDEIEELMHECIDEVRKKLTYKICYRELIISISEDLCDFGLFSLKSKGLAKNLKDCGSVIVFAATIGIEADRLTAKYSRISPSKALMLQAIGAERIESLCDAFCADISADRHIDLRPRFSPGYGDLPLEAQKEIFDVLECQKRIGLFLNDSLIMSPSKSVTAFLGLSDRGSNKNAEKCSYCNNTDCSYRSVQQ